MLTTIISEALAQSFEKKTAGKECIPFDEFVEWALYDSEIGYYQKPLERVGKSPASDFYTSATIHGLWRELIIEACVQLIGPHSSDEVHFVEIAAEPDTSLLSDDRHPFASSSVIRLGDSIEIPPLSIVFSNEWLDSQPFKRYSYSQTDNSWCEHAVRLEQNRLREIRLDKPVDPSADFYRLRLETASDGYTIDWPIGAKTGLSQLLLKQKWNGLFLTFDYGLHTQDLLRNRPSGTARSYRRHKLSSHILENPGDQDITCHLCWDQLTEVMKIAGFENINLHSQESFLMHYASKTLRERVTRGSLKEKSEVKELIHPSYLGQKFQALSGKRGI